MSSLVRVRNGWSLFQSNVCNLFLPGDFAAVHVIGVSVIAGCPQGESWLCLNKTSLRSEESNQQYRNTYFTVYLKAFVPADLFL